MFARLQTSRTTASADALLDPVAGRPGFAGGWLLSPIAAPDGAALTLWHSREDAHAVSEHPAVDRDPRSAAVAVDTLYRVEDDVPGAGIDEDAAYAQLVYFDGPRTAEWSTAVLRADRERIDPAVRDLPGAVRTLVLVGDDNAHLVVSLTTDVTALELARQRIMATELLPWEEPALLTGPDRINLHRVAAVRRPSPAVPA